MSDSPTSDQPPVVLVHGLATSSARTWVETGFADLLADAGRRVVTIDLPGHGGRDGLADEASYAEVASVIAADLPDGTFDAVGFSAGARILLRLASEMPERFDHLVLAGIGARAVLADEQAGFAGAIAASTDPGSEEADPIVRHFTELARSSGTDIAAVLAMLRHPGQPLDDEALARVDVDVLVVIGDRDPAGPGEPLVERLPSARLVVLPGVDHFATPKSMGFLDAALGHLGA